MPAEGYSSSAVLCSAQPELRAVDSGTAEFSLHALANDVFLALRWRVRCNAKLVVPRP